MSNAQLYATVTHAVFLQAVWHEARRGRRPRGGQMLLKRGLASPRLSWKASLGSDYFLASAPAERRLRQLGSGNEAVQAKGNLEENTVSKQKDPVL